MNDAHAVLRVLGDYYAAFSTLDVQTVLPYFHEPALLIGPRGLFAAATHAVLASAFAPAVADLRDKGFGRSELSVRDVRSLSETAALVTGVAQRFKVNGTELERVGVTYVLHKGDTDWRIAVLILHDVTDGGSSSWFISRNGSRCSKQYLMNRQQLHEYARFGGEAKLVAINMLANVAACDKRTGRRANLAASLRSPAELLERRGPPV
jgi:ketosteroid isomerase-like protein